jgi:hypothetical protein
MAKGGKKQEVKKESDELSPQLMTAIQDTQKKIEVIQGHLDKMQSRVLQEQRTKNVASLALNYLQNPTNETSVGKYYTQLGKAFAMKPLSAVKTELTDTITEVDKDLPKLLTAQGQFELKKKEQWHNLQQVAELAQQAKAN